MRLRLHRLRALLGRHRFEAEMAAELRNHIEAYTDDLVRRGWTRAAAARQARVEFGNVESVKEELRRTRGLRLVDEAVQDVRFAARALARGPALAVIAVVALGVGLNLAVFSVVQAVLLRPLPHPDPDRLVAVVGVNGTNGQAHNLSAEDMFDVERLSRSFVTLGGMFPPGFNLTGGGVAERVPGARINHRFFDVFGVRPVLGRGFLPEEERPGAERVAIVSHGIWSRRFNRDRAVVGQSITLSGVPHTIVGVMAEGFDSPAFRGRNPEVWVPLGTDPNLFDRGARALRVFGRLRPSATVEGVNEEVASITAVLRERHPDAYRDTEIRVESLHGQLIDRSRDALIVLALSVSALLLVAAMNTASLLLGWTLRRRPELAMRMALGAGRSRVVRQISTEGVVLAVAAAVIGFGATLLASDAIVYAARVAGMPRSGEIRIGLDLLLLGFGLSLAITTVAGVAAALVATRHLEYAAARTQAATTVTPRRRSRGALIAAEAALSLALLAGAGLLLRSFLELRAVEPGVDATNLIATTVSLPADRYPEGPVMGDFYERLLGRVRSIPGVDAAAVVDWLPLSGMGAATGFSVDRREERPPGTYPMADVRVVSSDYFLTMGIPLRVGRVLDRRDTEAGPAVVVINEALARRYFGSSNPVGRRLAIERSVPVTAEIVGVVGDVRQYSLQLASGPEIFAPKTQQPWMRHVTRDLVIRAEVAARVTPQVVSAVRALDPDIPVGELLAMGEIVDVSLRRPRVQSIALLAFAMTATLLAAFGIYGAVATAVIERNREFGVRLALGAHAMGIWWTAARHGAVPALIGLALGVPLAFGAGRLLRQQLFGIGPADGATLLIVTAVLAVVATIAAIVPAWRATRVDPVIAIRT